MMNTTEIERKYREEIRPQHETYALRLAALLRDLAAAEGIPLANVEQRAKTVESLLQKIDKKNYRDPLHEIKDLTGIRLITYYQDDVARLQELIASELVVDSDHSSDKLRELAVDEFGYRSIHVIVRLDESRYDLPEWRRFRDLDAEVQIRSVLQHAWAAISHKLDYKLAREAPAELRRPLFRLSALLELADEVFVSLRDRSSAITAKYRDEVAENALDLPLNLDSLEAYLTGKGVLEHFEAIGLRLGMPPHGQQELPGSKARLLAALAILDAKTVADARDRIDEIRADADERLEEFVSKVREYGNEFIAVGWDLIFLLLRLKHSIVNEKLRSDHEFWREGLEDAVREFSGPRPQDDNP